MYYMIVKLTHYINYKCKISEYLHMYILWYMHFQM